MSLPLKPLTMDSSSKKLDSKQKRFNCNISKALEHFEFVTEWADYIASLGKLLKALQSWVPPADGSIKYYVPLPYQVSRKLASSLSPNLPAGVHQKTLEVYTYIFEKIGTASLAVEINIWLRGILPLMTYAAMSVKVPLMEVYEKFLIQLPSDTLKLIIKPLLSSLLPGIDDESSEFQPCTMKLIDRLKGNLKDDSLFWQTCYIITISNKDRRLGALVWMNKRFPSLNVVYDVDTFSDATEVSSIERFNINKKKALELLADDLRSVVSPEPGLLVRALVSCLDTDNDILIKRGVLDLLIQKLHLCSPVLEFITTFEDKKLLIIGCCKITLNKDMSLNRRIWKWLLGPTGIAGSNSVENLNTIKENRELYGKNETNQSQYFKKHSLNALLQGLNDMISREASVTTVFNICLAIMDRWEIGSIIVPEMFIPLLLISEKYSTNSDLIRSASSFFDAIETNIIWGKIFEYFNTTKDIKFMYFVLTTFHISQDEEIIIRHLPMILLAMLTFKTHEYSNETLKINRYTICKQLIEVIPERAFLPLEGSVLKEILNVDKEEVVNDMLTYYTKVSDPVEFQNLETSNILNPPFSPNRLTCLIFVQCKEILLKGLEKDQYVNETAEVFVSIFEKIPDYSVTEKNNELISSNNLIIKTILEATTNNDIERDSLHGIILIYTRYLWREISVLESSKILKVIISSLWKYLLDPHEQNSTVKYLEILERNVNPLFIEAALTAVFVEKQSIVNRVTVLDLLWNSLEPSTKLINRILELILDELFDEQASHYIFVSKWILSILDSGSSNRLLEILSSNIIEFEFLYNSKITGVDDLDMLTYRLQIITAVLNSNGQLVIKCASKDIVPSSITDKWVDVTISTYKDLILSIVINFLKLENNHHVKSIRSSLILLDIFLNGTEENFKEIVLSLLQLSSKYIAEQGIESESIGVSLLNIVAKLLQLSHKNGIRLDIFDNSSTHLKYIDYLVTSVSKMEGSMIISSYIELLLGSVLYFESSIFKYLLPLTNSVVGCLKKLFLKEKTAGGYFQSISLLLGGLEELLKLSHGYLLADEKDGVITSVTSRSDFLQSMVSNVFAGDTSGTAAKLHAERLVVLQSFQQVISCSLDIWYWAHETTLGNVSKILLTPKNHSSYRFKFRTKSLMERLFLLEPLEALENVISIPKDDYTISLVHILDGNRPIMTVPYLFYGIVMRCNKNAVVKFSTNIGNVTGGGNTKSLRLDPSLINRINSQLILDFLFFYVESLENAAFEEVYSDFNLFFKEVCTNSTYYSSLSIDILKFVALCSEKINKSKFGEQRNVRKELSDLFVRYLSTAVADISKYDGDSFNSKIKNMNYIVQRLQYCINDGIGSDKYNNVVSTIVSHSISPYLNFNEDKVIPIEIYDLSKSISKIGGKVKNWKSLIDDIFSNDRKFPKINSNQLWDGIIFEWSNYSENKSKLLPELLSVIDFKGITITPALINFSSSSTSEINSKCKNILRVSYLLMISPNDTYLLNFKVLIVLASQHLESKHFELRSVCWVLLRAMLLKFLPSHFNEHWSTIVFCLQSNMQEFYELLKLQETINDKLVLQLSKTLDLLLILNIEDFSSTNEWLFIIDTINCIYKTSNFISLVDEIAECKDYNVEKEKEITVCTNSRFRVPLLCGVNSINTHLQLRQFFQKLSYMHYESVYSLQDTDIKICESDLIRDIFSLS